MDMEDIILLGLITALQRLEPDPTKEVEVTSDWEEGDDPLADEGRVLIMYGQGGKFTFGLSPKDQADEATAAFAKDADMTIRTPVGTFAVQRPKEDDATVQHEPTDTTERMN